MATTRSPRRASATEPRRSDAADLESRYGAIGILAVAAAVQVVARPEKEESRHPDAFAARLAEAET